MESLFRLVECIKDRSVPADDIVADKVFTAISANKFVPLRLRHHIRGLTVLTLSPCHRNNFDYNPFLSLKSAISDLTSPKSYFIFFAI